MPFPGWTIGDRVRVYQGDCRKVLPTLPAQSVDCVITDPPYPGIKRPYGYWTEEEWLEMMKEVVTGTMRVLKPTGSAVFILQPNSEKVGRMRTWLWEFMVWAGKKFGILQDVYWWNPSTPPTIHCQQARGLMRPSVKTGVWIGNPDCYRNQQNVLIPIADSVLRDKRVSRVQIDYQPSGHHIRRARVLAACKQRNGSTPYNLQIAGNGDAINSSGSFGHGAGTSLSILDWWVKYLCHPEGTVLDPFSGLATTGVACLKNGVRYIGIEKEPEYVTASRVRLQKEIEKLG